MKKLLILFLLIFIPINTEAKPVTTEIYYGVTCPYCHEELNYLEKLQKRFKDNIEIKKYEVWENEENNKLMESKKENLNVKESGVPFTVIGNTAYLGFNSQIQKQIESTFIKNIKNPSFPVIKEAKNMPKPITSIFMGIIDLFSKASIITIIAISIISLLINKKYIILAPITLSLTYIILILTNSLNTTPSLLLTVTNIMLIIFSALLISPQKKETTCKNIIIPVLAGISLSLLQYQNATPILLAKYLNGQTLNTILYAISFFIGLTILCLILNKLLNKIKTKYIISGICLLIIACITILIPDVII